MIWYFVIGVCVGLALALPVVYLAIRRTEARTRQFAKRAQAAERLAELGTLTGGLAHEIKNPLSTIGLNLQLLRESVEDLDLPSPEHSRLTKRLDAVSNETDRLRGILEDFLSFAGRVKIDPVPTDINDILEQLVDFYHPQAESSQIRIRADLDPDAGRVHLDPTLFKQALLNLMINATQAMVDARYDERAHGGADELILRTEPVSDGVAVHVIDTGPGIPEDTLNRIFAPYFTTKRGGTGLGLATTRRIINEHGGSISVHSDPARGSDFTLIMPREGPEG